MINNRTKKGLLLALSLIITSCSTSINPVQEIKSSNSVDSKSKNISYIKTSDKSYNDVKTFLTNEEFDSLKKEYSGFKTLALSYEYLHRKVKKLLTYTDNGLYLTREIEFARVIHPSLLLQIYCDHPELYSDSDIKPKVIERKTNDSIFNDYLVQLSCGSGGGGGSTTGEFQINSYTTSGQHNSSIAMDGTGNFVVAWHSIDQDGSGYGIYAQRYNSNGIPQGAEFQVNTYTNSNQYYPSVAMDNTGNFVITWQSLYQDGASLGIYAQRYNSNGTPNGSEFRVNSYTTNVQREPSIAMNNLGRFIITWASYSQDGDNYSTQAQIYNSDGTPNGSEFQVNTYTTDSQRLPSIAMDNTGNFIVTWSSLNQDGDFYGIYAQRYNSNGIPQGAEFQVNTYTNSYQINSKVSMNNSGNFVITWQSLFQDGDNNGIYAQRYNSNGIPQGAEFQVNTYIDFYQMYPSIAMDNTGNFIVTWSSLIQDGSGYGIYAQRYNSNGIPQGAEFQVNTHTTNNQNIPSIAMNNIGSFVITWTSESQDGNSAGVYGKRFDSNGNDL